MKRLLAILMAVGVTGCGYSFVGAGSVLPPDVQNVYVPVVQNASTESTVSGALTDALQDEFERYGTLRVVDSASEADAVLQAKVLSVKRSTASVTSRTDSALQYDTVLSIAAELRRTNGQLLWRDPTLAVSRTFGTTSDVVVKSSVDFAAGGLSSRDLGNLDSREIAREQEQEALALLVEEAAKRIYRSAVLPEF